MAFTVSILSIIAFPLIILEYYFTKERITLEGGEATKPTVLAKEQIKAIFSEKYCLIIFAYFILIQISSQLKNISLVYYCNYVLGTYNDGYTQSLVSVVGGLPFAYVFMALFADVLDHLEWKNGFRCDGMAMSIYSIIFTVTVGIGTGIFNLGLSLSGYVAPVYDIAQKATIAYAQNEATQNVLIFFFVGLEIIVGAVCAILLLRLDVEKVIEKEQVEILERKNKASS